MLITGKHLQSPFTKFSVIGISLNTVTHRQFADMKKGVQRELEVNFVSTLHIRHYFFLSTCNRLELYFLEGDKIISSLDHDTVLINIVARGYIKTGYEAIRHLARVASGMDSKILGDYEIVSQVKNASSEAIERGTFNTLLEKITGFALLVSKRIRTETKISQGITSYASAAVDILQREKKDKLRIAVIGTGDIGRQVVNYLAADKKKNRWDVTIFNRTAERAEALARAENFSFAGFEKLIKSSDQFDVLINCADLQEEDVQDFFSELPRMVIDLTPQQAFERLAKQRDKINYFSLDQIHNNIENIKKGKQDQLMACESIIDTCITEMHQNQKIRNSIPLLHRYGDVLHLTAKESLSDISYYRSLVVNHVFKKTKNSSLNGCDMISVFSESRLENRHE